MHLELYSSQGMAENDGIPVTVCPTPSVCASTLELLFHHG
jgi:hypothetical protein